jgi:pimeloyl-ACP methyl ester carboxylesterase
VVTTGYIEHDVFVRDLKLHYQEWGNASAPPILMLHGFGVSGHMFDEFAERMQDRYRLIALDQRGHGDSDWSPDGDYSRQAFVNDVEGFREALGLERFILVGHSMGGLNAVTYTVEHPEHVRALVLVDVGPEAAKEGVDNIVRFTRGPDELEFDEFVEMAHRFNQRRSIDNIRERMRHRLKPTEGGKWTWKFDKRFRQDQNGLKIGSSLTNDETWQLYRSVRVPTLIVRGAESDVLSPEVAERAAREMQRAKLVVVASAGHSVPGDNPDDFTAAVREFIGELDTGRFEPAAAAEPPPLKQLMQEQEARERRGPGLMTMVLIGVGASAALAGLALLASSQSKKKPGGVRGRVRAAAPLVAEPLRAVDVEKVRERAAELVGDLAVLSRGSMARARTTLNEVDIDRARSSAIEIVHALGDRTRGAQGAVRQAVGRAGSRKPKKQGWFRSRGKQKTRSLALRLVMAGATRLLVSGLRQEKPRRKLLAWRG